MTTETMIAIAILAAFFVGWYLAKSLNERQASLTGRRMQQLRVQAREKVADRWNEQYEKHKHERICMYCQRPLEEGFLTPWEKEMKQIIDGNAAHPN